MYGRYPYQGQIPPPPQGGQGLTSNPGGFGQGVMQFIQSYRGEAAAKKENAAKMFEKHAAMLAQGLPVDKKKMAKWAREADLHFDLDPPPPPPAQPPMPQAQGAAPGMPPGAMPPPPPAAMAGMQNFERGLPQRQSAEQAYMAANGGPSMAARAGMQNFEQGMPQRQAAEQAYQQANPRQPGFLKRLISGIGEATGVPQPPTQAQQMGVMKMLQEIEQRGQSSREMAAMKADVQRSVLSAMQTINKKITAGDLDMADPETAAAIRTLVVSGGSGDGKFDIDAIGKVLNIPGFRDAFGGIAKKIDEKVEDERKKKAKEKYRTTVAGMVKDPEKAAKAESWVFGETDEFPDFGSGVDPMEPKKFVASLMKERPGVTPEQASAVAIAMFSPDATEKDVADAYKGLPESIEQTRLKMSQTQLGLSKKADARAEKTQADAEALKTATGSIIQFADMLGGDEKMAFDQAEKFAIAAFGGDMKAVKKYLPDIKKILKGLIGSEGGSFEERMAVAIAKAQQAAKEPE